MNTTEHALFVFRDYQKQLAKHQQQVVNNDPETDKKFPVTGVDALQLFLAEERRLAAQGLKMKEYGAKLVDTYQHTEEFQPLPLFIQGWDVDKIIQVVIKHLETLLENEE